jgi:NhaA family Na+:H+ antiporter
MFINPIRRFFELESAGGLLLIAMTCLALLLKNSWLSAGYDAVLNTNFLIQLGDMVVKKSVVHWINDGLMAIFFLIIGLEVKREVLEGQLSTRAQVMLPTVAAIGGLIMPALIFVFFI